jgi:hypothetical protein
MIARCHRRVVTAVALMLGAVAGELVAERISICSLVEEVHKMAKCLSARIVVDFYPRTLRGLSGLFQSQSDVAKWTPTPCIEKA